MDPMVLTRKPLASWPAPEGGTVGGRKERRERALSPSRRAPSLSPVILSPPSFTPSLQSMQQRLEGRRWLVAVRSVLADCLRFCRN